jgi:hypothetical protein
MARYAEVFREFFRKWWSGPDSVAGGAQREVGFCVGPLKKTPFVRRFSNLDAALASIPFRDFKQLNLFTSVAFYPDIDLNEADVSKALYDRLFYDFDCEESPRLAVEKAIEFVKSLKARFGCDAVVAVSGIRGAHVTIPLKKPITWKAYEKLWDALIAPHSFSGLIDPQVKEPKRLCRVPYTYNIKYDDEKKQVVTGFSYIIDLSGRRVRIEEFDWSSYEPLDPTFALDAIEIETPLLSLITNKNC